MFTYQQALHLIRTHITGFLMVYASTSAPEFPKTPEDFWKGGEINQDAWNVVLKDVMAKDFEDHVPKVLILLYLLPLFRSPLISIYCLQINLHDHLHHYFFFWGGAMLHGDL